MTRGPLNNRALASACLLISALTPFSLRADIIQHDEFMTATQQVNLLGVQATLVASGVANFTFDVDTDNNSVLGGSTTVDTLFKGTLPAEFAVLDADGLDFELFSIDPESVNVSGNGTHVRIETTFGFRVFDDNSNVIANFYTLLPSVFEADVASLTNFAGAVFQDSFRPLDLTEIFIGESLVPGLPPSGLLAGISFDRTVTAVPEPSAFALAIIAVSAIGLAAVRRRRLTRLTNRETRG